MSVCHSLSTYCVLNKEVEGYEENKGCKERAVEDTLRKVTFELIYR